MKKIIPIIVAIFGMTCLSAADTTIDKHFHQSYDVNKGASFYLEHGDGDVTITAWEKDVVDIDVVYHAEFTGLGHFEPKDFTVEFEKRGDRISVIAHEPHLIGIGSHRVQQYTFTIKAPAYVVLDLNGVDGNLDISDWQNTIQAKNVDGDVSVTNVTADRVEIRCVDGDTRLQNAAATLQLESVDGNIIITDVNAPECRCKSIDGDIEINSGTCNVEASAVDGNISLRNISTESLDLHTSDGRILADLAESKKLDGTLRTSDGSIELRLAKGTSVTLEVRTGDGNIRTELSPVEKLESDDNLFRGAINGGRGSLSLHTGDGDVEIIEK